jgi:hypothetical protein
VRLHHVPSRHEQERRECGHGEPPRKAGKGQHIGLAIDNFNVMKKEIHTVEGNTGEASQANGDGVALKTRPLKFIRCVVRPKYPIDQVSGAETEVKK